MDRRNFLKSVSYAGIAGLILPRSALAADPSANSRVIILDDTAATSGTTINASVIQSIISSGIKSLAQGNDVGEAWKAMLPGVTATSKIGIKVNCINSSLSSHPAVANAIANSIRQMMFGGTAFPANNIIVFDRTESELRGAGYTINTSTTGVRCFATGTTGVGYSTQTYNVSGSSQQLSKIVTETIDFLINLAVLKNHSGAGVTLCLKNHYGTCSNPGGLHGNLCNPYAAAMSDLAPIRTKQKVNIIDALYGIRSGGPDGPPQFTAKTIIMSADIVATDYWGRKLLADNGCTTTGDADHIDVAATTYGLGTNDPAKMDVVRIHNPSTTGVEPAPVPREVQLHQNFPNPFNPSTYIQFDLDRPLGVRLRVVDLAGRVVRTLIDGAMPAGEHVLFFDGRDLASGTYICELEAAGSRLFQKMILLK
jgi:uncharacterized protein (DUF362 family)